MTTFILSCKEKMLRYSFVHVLKPPALFILLTNFIICMSAYYKKLVLVTFLFLFAFEAFAPSSKSLVIIAASPEEPFKKLVHAIGMVETKFDSLSYNLTEMAAGCFQIRPILLQDYNKRTGSKYSMNDLFRYNISEKIFLYYASVIGPYDLERIAKKWNGKGKETIQYWDQVKRLL